MRSYLVNETPQQYGVVLRQQEELFDSLIEAKQVDKASAQTKDEYCILCVHDLSLIHI